MSGDVHILKEEGLFAELWHYRYALHNLILKDFRVRYRNMSLGIAWSVLNPLVMLGVLVIVFNYLNPNRAIPHFPIFLLLGLISYNFFCMCIGVATGCILDNASLVKKVIFPREILPISVVLSQIIHLLIQFLVLAVFVVLFRIPPTLALAWFPLIYLVETLFIFGVSFFVSALNVYYRDTLYLVDSALRILFWFTPIFYALPMVKLNLPKPLYYVYLLNPLVGFTDASRQVVLWGRAPDWIPFGIATAVSVITFVLGFAFFNRVKKNFADKI